MSCEEKLKISISLRRLAIVKVATLLWSNSDVKTEILDFFLVAPDESVSSEETRIFKSANSKLWQMIITKVINNANVLSLPANVLTDLKSFIVWMVKKVHSWMSYALNELKIDRSLAEIHWTQQGLIDQKKIYALWYNKLDWKEYKNFHGLVDIFSTYGETLSNKAKLLHREYKKMVDNEKISIAQLKQLEFFIAQAEILEAESLNLRNCLQEILNHDYRVNDIFNEGNPTVGPNTDKMIVKYLFWGLSSLFKMLFGQMTDNEQQKCLSKIIKSDLYNFYDSTSSFSYRTEKVIESLIFVINNMNQEQKLEFLKLHGFFFLKKVISVWPYFEDIFPSVFNEIEMYLTEQEKIDLFFVAAKVTSNEEDAYLNFDFFKNISTPLLSYWNLLGTEEKEKIISYPDTFKDLVLHRNSTGIILLVSDQDLQIKRRNKIMLECQEEVDRLIKVNPGKYDEFCNIFLKKIIRDFENKKMFDSVDEVK